MPTFRLAYTVVASSEHPEAAVLGECMVVGWLHMESLEEARARTKAVIQDQHFLLKHEDQVEEVERADFDLTDPDDADELKYFEQAQVDGEVYVTHVSPRHSVFEVGMSVRWLDGDAKLQPAAHAALYLSAEQVFGVDGDFYKTQLWDEEKSEQAAAQAKQRARELGLECVKILAAAPVDGAHTPDDIANYFEAAEDCGECFVVFDEQGAELVVVPELEQ